jgi:DNA-binding SARP family transcriptional activator
MLHLLGEFELVVGNVPRAIPIASRRLLALLAVRPGGIARTAAEEELWPDHSRSRSSANLRSALWRIQRLPDFKVVECWHGRLRLSTGVVTDLHGEMERARALVQSRDATGADAPPGLGELGLRLLPGWHDEWLLLDRERWDQLRLHALEALARRRVRTQDYVGALEAALEAVTIEPYRESAQRVLIEIHIAEGNYATALRQYQRYRGMLQRELGIGPTPQLDRLVQPLTAG